MRSHHTLFNVKHMICVCSCIQHDPYTPAFCSFPFVEHCSACLHASTNAIIAETCVVSSQLLPVTDASFPLLADPQKCHVEEEQ